MVSKNYKIVVSYLIDDVEQSVTNVINWDFDASTIDPEAIVESMIAKIPQGIPSTLLSIGNGVGPKVQRFLEEAGVI